MGMFSNKKNPDRFNKIFKGKPVKGLTLRRGSQLLTLAVLTIMGIQFADFINKLEQGLPGGVRPGGVEGFLPIGALISLKHWFASGEFSMVHPAGLVILILVLGTGFLLRKAFCSWICPVGLLSEILARLAHLTFKIRIKLPRWLDWPLMSLKYIILIFFAYAVFVQMSPQAIKEFIALPYNRVADIKMFYFFAHITPFAAWTVAILTLLSYLVPYFWCRYLCPYGALLGVFGPFSLTRVKRSPESCTDCGKCSAVCPSFISVDKKINVLSPECIGYMECVESCPVGDALVIATPVKFKLSPKVFAIALFILFWGGIGIAQMTGYWQSDIPRHELQYRVQKGLDDPVEYGHFRGGCE